MQVEKITVNMRISCVYCDTTEGDEVERIPDGWEEVAPVEDEGGAQWWDHLGLCRDCALLHNRPRPPEPKTTSECGQ